MAPKTTARQRAIALHADGLGQAEVRQQMLRSGYAKAIVSKVLSPWPPELSTRAANGSATGSADANGPLGSGTSSAGDLRGLECWNRFGQGAYGASGSGTGSASASVRRATGSSLLSSRAEEANVDEACESERSCFEDDVSVVSEASAVTPTVVPDAAATPAQRRRLTKKTKDSAALFDPVIVQHCQSSAAASGPPVLPDAAEPPAKRRRLTQKTNDSAAIFGPVTVQRCPGRADGALCCFSTQDLGTAAVRIESAAFSAEDWSNVDQCKWCDEVQLLYYGSKKSGRHILVQELKTFWQHNARVWRDAVNRLPEAMKRAVSMQSLPVPAAFRNQRTLNACFASEEKINGFALLCKRCGDQEALQIAKEVCMQDFTEEQKHVFEQAFANIVVEPRGNKYCRHPDCKLGHNGKKDSYMDMNVVFSTTRTA